MEPFFDPTYPPSTTREDTFSSEPGNSQGPFALYMGSDTNVDVVVWEYNCIPKKQRHVKVIWSNCSGSVAWAKRKPQKVGCGSCIYLAPCRKDLLAEQKIAVAHLGT